MVASTATMRIMQWYRVAAVLLLVCNVPRTIFVAFALEFTQSCVAVEETQYFCGLHSPHLPSEKEMWEPQPPHYDGSSTGLSPDRNKGKHLNLTRVWRGLTRIANLHNFSSDKPVVLGFGACKDVIVDAVSLLNTLVKEGLIDDRDIRAVHHDEIVSFHQLAEVFVFFFSNGAAAERSISNATVSRAVIDLALKEANSQSSLGGNAALMAARMVTLGAQNVTLALSTGSRELRDALPPHLRIIGGPPVPSSEDDVHLTLEYKKGDTWGEFVSPRTNRFAFNHDVGNAELWALESLAEDIAATTHPALIIVGGFQLMQGYTGWDDGQWVAETNGGWEHDSNASHPARPRLMDVYRLLKPILGRGTKLHLEFASVSDIGFMKELRYLPVALADSIGANEQELGILWSYLINGNMQYVAPHTPRVAQVLVAMRTVFTQLSQDFGNFYGTPSKLSRLHVHTLAYQAIIATKDDWPDLEAATASAALAAAKWVCPSSLTEQGSLSILLDSSFSASTANRSTRIDLDEEHPVTCWDEKRPHGLSTVTICVAPNPVCVNPEKTIGAGDSISASGLLPHFHSLGSQT